MEEVCGEWGTLILFKFLDGVLDFLKDGGGSCYILSEVLFYEVIDFFFCEDVIDIEFEGLFIVLQFEGFDVFDYFLSDWVIW